MLVSLGQEDASLSSTVLKVCHQAPTLSLIGLLELKPNLDVVRNSSQAWEMHESRKSKGKFCWAGVESGRHASRVPPTTHPQPEALCSQPQDAGGCHHLHCGTRRQLAAFHDRCRPGHQSNLHSTGRRLR